MVPVPPIPMLWHGMPPELNTARLMVGAGEAPMLQAAAGWEAMAIALEAQAAELASALASLAAAWTGTANERAISAAMPMVMWLQTLAMQAQKRSLQAAAQAASYAAAMAATPPIPEIEENHVTHAVLEGTNFLGVNTGAICANEADYFVRMWNQAALAMDGYQAETMLNVMFEPIMPMTPIVIPGVGEATSAAALGQIAAMAPGTLARDLALTHVSLQSKAESVALQAGRGVNMANMAATQAEGQASKTRNVDSSMQQQAQQAPQQMMQMGSQIGSQLASLPQQLSQMVQSPMQQLTQPLQQVTSMFSQMGGSHHQMGLLGASPLSNHPLAGGSGMSSGAGLVRAASVPGSGGSAPRTQLLAKMLDRAEMPSTPSGAAAGNTVAGGTAPVGAGGGGGAPIGAASHGGPSGRGSRAALVAPTPLLQDLGEDDADDW